MIKGATLFLVSLNLFAFRVFAEFKISFKGVYVGKKAIFWRGIEAF